MHAAGRPCGAREKTTFGTAAARAAATPIWPITTWVKERCRPGYIRGTFDDKPFTLGKYEHTRFRVTISELAANGGVPMGLYARFTDPDARDVFVRYYGSSANSTTCTAPTGRTRKCACCSRGATFTPTPSCRGGQVKKIRRAVARRSRAVRVRPVDLPPPAEGQYDAVIDVTKNGTGTAFHSVLPRRSARCRSAPWYVRLSASRPANERQAD